MLPDMNIGWKLEVGTTVTFISAFIVVMLRTLARTLYATLGWDDYLMLFAVAQAFVATICDYIAVNGLASNDAHQLIPSLGGKPTLMNYLQGKRYFLALPVFHAACLTFVLAFNIFSGVTCVLPPAGPLTADVANEVFLHGNLDGAL
ncbi:hypothetical protein EYZ11_008522 [Aspergillus tanneri]|nr:hypothetical protein EYZ11_008522 [Aspergillus tanneri]